VLFADLRSRGLWDPSFIIVTSDHGEEFREHGRFIHVQPYVENLAIPLMIKFPENEHAGRRMSGLVETVDFLPSLLEIAGARPPDHVQGTSFLPMIAAAAAGKATSLGRDKLDRDRFTLRSDRFTLVHNTREDITELYDIFEDATEARDVLSDYPDEAAALKELLLEAIDRNAALAEELDTLPLVDEEVLSEEEKELLRAIGYVE
jgi:arylsulfatase A-like enzyme